MAGIGSAPCASALFVPALPLPAPALESAQPPEPRQNNRASDGETLPRSVRHADTPEQRRAIRKRQNVESAMRSRQKKRAETKAMEDMVVRHGAKIESLEQRVVKLHNEILNVTQNEAPESPSDFPSGEAETESTSPQHSLPQLPPSPPSLPLGGTMDPHHPCPAENHNDIAPVLKGERDVGLHARADNDEPQNSAYVDHVGDDFWNLDIDSLGNY